MCIISFMPSKAQRVGEDILAKCWSSNPDGAGLMYPNTERSILVVDKGHMTLAALQAAFKLVPEGVPVAVHFRIATHGPKDQANTHPHVVWPDEVAIVHNGILPIGAPADSKESDTARFARLVLPGLAKTWWKNAAMCHLIEEYMGKGNKLVVMDQTGSYKILNEEAGVWDSGVWFSNSTFRPYSYSTAVRVWGGYSDDDYTSGWQTAIKTGEASGQAVVSQAPTHVSGGSTVQPASHGVDAGSGDKAAHPEGIALTSLNSDDPLDPLLDQIVQGQLTADDRKILEMDIGTMTDDQFARYELMVCP
jgi:hypothetical protein